MSGVFRVSSPEWLERADSKDTSWHSSLPTLSQYENLMVAPEWYPIAALS